MIDTLGMFKKHISMTQAVPASYQANPVLRRPQSLPTREKEPALILERMVSITLSHDFDEATLPDECKPICDFVDQSFAHEAPTTIERYFGQARQLALVRAYLSHEGYMLHSLHT